MKLMRHGIAALLTVCLATALPARAGEAPSVPGIDAPELAKLGEHGVGVSHQGAGGHRTERPQSQGGPLVSRADRRGRHAWKLTTDA